MATELPNILPRQNQSFNASTTLPPLTPSPVTTFGLSLEPSQFVPCSPTLIPTDPNPRLKNHTKKVDRIKRPPNAFMLFRRYRTLQIEEERKWQGGPKLPQAVLSKLIGSEWKDLFEEENQKWYQMAQEEQLIHKERLRNYVYQPSRKTPVAELSKTLGQEWSHVRMQEAPQLSLEHDGKSPNSYHPRRGKDSKRDNARHVRGSKQLTDPQDGPRNIQVPIHSSYYPSTSSQIPGVPTPASPWQSFQADNIL